MSLIKLYLMLQNSRVIAYTIFEIRGKTKGEEGGGGSNFGAIALSYPPIVDDSSLKNAAESFTVALTLTLQGCKSRIAP